MRREHGQETFRVIDPTTGRIHAKRALPAKARRSAIVVAGCRGAAVIVRNGGLPGDVLPRIMALCNLATEVTPCRSAS